MPQDVWYKFKAMQKMQTVELEILTQSENKKIQYDIFQRINGKIVPYNCDTDYLLKNTFFTEKDSIYFVRVRNHSENQPFFKENTFKICITSPKIDAPPVNDKVCDAIALEMNETGFPFTPKRYTTQGATPSILPKITCDNFSNFDFSEKRTPDVWFKFKAVDSVATLVLSDKISESNTTFETELFFFLYKNECDSILLQDCEINFYQIKGLEKGKIYHIRTIGLARSPLKYTTFGLHLDTLPKFYPKNDFCKNAIILPMNIGYKTKFYEKCRLYNATCDSIPPNVFGNACKDAYPYNVDVWYKFVATQEFHLLVHNNITNPNNTKITKEVFRGNCDQLILEKCSNDVFDTGQLILDDLTIGTTYFVRVHLNSWANNTKFPYEFNISVNEPTVFDANKCSTSKEILVSDFIKKDTFYTEINKKVRWYKFKPKQKHVVWEVLNLHNYVPGSIEFQLYEDCKVNGLFFPPPTFYNAEKKLLILDTSKTYNIKYLAGPHVAFDFQLYYLPNIPKNETCKDAKLIPINPTLMAINSVKDTMDNRLGYSELNSKWYEFTPTQTVHHLVIKNFKPQLDTFSFGTAGFATKDCQYIQNVHAGNILNDTILVFERLKVGERIKFQLIHTNYPFNVWRFYDTYDIAFVSPPIHKEDECGIAKELDISSNKIFPIDHKWSSIDSIYSHSCGNFFGTKAIWYKIKPINNTYKFKFSNIKTNFEYLSAEQFTIQVLKGTCNNLTPVVCKIIYAHDTTMNVVYEYTFSFVDTSAYYYIKLAAAKDISYQMSIEAVPNVANDFCKNAITIELNEPTNIIHKYTGDLKNTNVENTNDFCSLDERDLWYKFTPKTDKAALYFKLKKPINVGEMNGGLYIGDCNNLFHVQCVSPETDSLVIFYKLIPNKVYYLKFSDKGIDGTTEFDFHLIDLPNESNEECQSAAEITVNESLTPLNYTKGVNAWNFSSLHLLQGVGVSWYKFTATATQHRIWFKSKYYDTKKVQIHKIAVLRGGCGDLVLNRIIQNPADSSNSSLLLGGLNNGAEYYIAVVQNFEFGRKTEEIFELAVTQSNVNFSAYTCQKALTIPVNLGIIPSQKLNVKTVGSPIEWSQGANFTEVWFKFLAKSKRHKIIIDNIKTDSLHEVNYYDFFVINSCAEGSGAPIYNTQDSTLEDLVTGKFYYFSVRFSKIPKDSESQILQNNANLTFDIAIVSYPNRPKNDLAENAISLPVSANAVCANTTKGTTLAAQYETNSSGCSYVPRSVWYEFIAKKGYHVIDLKNLSPNAKLTYELFLEENTSSSLILVACKEKEEYPNKPLLLIEGKKYKINIFNKNPFDNYADFEICVKTMLENDEINGASELITDPDGKCIAPLSIASDLATITLSPIIPLKSCGFLAPTPDIWFKTLIKSKELYFNFIKKPQGTTPKIAVYRNTGSVAFITDICQNDTLKNLTIGETLYFRLWSYENIKGSYEICVNGSKSTTINESQNDETTFFSIAPNPVLDNFTIIANSFFEEKNQLFIYNTLGQKVFSTTFLEKNKIENINIGTLASGIYYIEIMQNNKKWVKKFSKI